MKELNFRLNELYAEVLQKYLEICCLTLETDNIVPAKFLNKIDKTLFKQLLKRQWKQCKKINKFEIRQQRKQRFKERFKLFFKKIKPKEKEKRDTSLVKESNENTVN